MSGLEPAAAAAALGATEAAGAGMAATAWADAVAAGLAAGLTPAAVAPIAATAAGSSVPGVALPVAQAAGTQGLSGAMGQLAPVYTAGMNTAGLAGPGGSGTVMGTVLPGMNQGANLLTTPFAKAIDTMGPGLRKAAQGWQVGQRLMGQPSQQARPMAAAPAAPAIPQMGGQPRQTLSPPDAAKLAAYQRVQQRRKGMMGRMT